MKRLLAVSFLCLAFALPGFSQHKTTPRPHYGGGNHTESRGGAYPGGHGSSHKGGPLPQFANRESVRDTQVAKVTHVCRLRFETTGDVSDSA
jgi:hypothetical protein